MTNTSIHAAPRQHACSAGCQTCCLADYHTGRARKPSGGRGFGNPLSTRLGGLRDRTTNAFSSVILALAALSLHAENSLTNALPPLAAPYGEIPPTWWEQHGTVLVLAGISLLALAGFLAWRRFRPQPPAPVPPAAHARATLAPLGGLPEDGPRLSEISQALRRYLRAALGFPPGEWTTSECGAILTGGSLLSPELAQPLIQLLRECDQRKFAPSPAGPPLNAAVRALELVEQVEGFQACQPAAADRPSPT